jgi:nucleolar protein 56
MGIYMERKELLDSIKQQLRNSVYTDEDFLQHTSHTIDELDEVLNILFERLTNWYSIYLPEIQHADRRETYLEVVQQYDKTDPKTAEKLSERAKNLVDTIEGESIGAVIEGKDLDILREYAVKLKKLYELRAQLEGYRDYKAKEIAPNLTHLLGESLATKLIVYSKGLKRLAHLPASSIQVLGAEKALFMHLTKKTKPPKHGIIFLHPAMRGISPKKRGKVARLIAAKVSIAAKADVYSKEFIAEKLKADLDEKLKNLNK